MDVSEYLPMFLAEGREHLQELNLAVVRIEEHPDDPETVDEIFRIAHSLKGMSATMGFAGMAALTHEMEDVFELLRQRSGGLGRDAVTVLLRCLDALAEAVDAIEADGTEQIVPEPLIAELRGLVRERTPDQSADRTGEPADAHAPPAEAVVDRRVVRVDVQLADDVQMPSVRAYMVLSALAEKGELISSAPLQEHVDAFDGRELHAWLATEEVEEALIAFAGAVPDVAAVQAAVEAPEEEEVAEAAVSSAPAGGHKPKGALTVRVDAERLDQLMHYMGELVLHRTQVEGLAAQADVPGISQAMQNLTRTSHALQQMVMQVRMIPVEAVFLCSISFLLVPSHRGVRELLTRLGLGD
jgi:two-component system, chemotaxis family, sensor kinase CheA